MVQAVLLIHSLHACFEKQIKKFSILSSQRAKRNKKNTITLKITQGYTAISPAFFQKNLFTYRSKLFDLNLSSLSIL